MQFIGGRGALIIFMGNCVINQSKIMILRTRGAIVVA